MVHTQLDLVMAHRYLYFVLGQPILPDPEYNKLLRLVRETLPFGHPVQWIGSTRAMDYTRTEQQLAFQLRKERV